MAGTIVPTCESRFEPDCSLETVPLLFAERQHRAVSLACADGSRVPSERETRAASFWNLSALFVLFIGPQPGSSVFPPGRARKTENLWERQEVVECFVGHEARRTNAYWEFEVAPDGCWLDLDVRLRQGRVVSEAARETGFRCRSILERDVWSAVLEIPWSILSSLPDIPRVWDCNFYRAAPSELGGHLMAWSPTGYGPQCFHQPEKFGHLILRGDVTIPDRESEP
jgi:hypothetical protein